MTIRIEVQPDGDIEIMRPGKDESIRFLTIDTLDRAIPIIRYLLRREIERVRKERFVPILEAACKRELRKQLKDCQR